MSVRIDMLGITKLNNGDCAIGARKIARRIKPGEGYAKSCKRR